MTYIINGNFGDATIALLQFAHNHGLTPVTLCYVNTGWAAAHWQNRITAGTHIASQYGIAVVELTSPQSFSDLVRARASFPSIKFQWCPALLKGLPILEWLDQIDPSGTATIISGRRKQASRANQQLPIYQTENIHYGERRTWYPLCDMTDTEFHALIAATGLAPLGHRALECDPCIHSTYRDLACLQPESIAKTAALEQEINTLMFQSLQVGQQNDIAAVSQWARLHLLTLQNENPNEQFDMGCGASFACGE